MTSTQSVAVVNSWRMSPGRLAVVKVPTPTPLAISRVAAAEQVPPVVEKQKTATAVMAEQMEVQVEEV